MQVRAEFRDTMYHYSWDLNYDENLLDEINEIANKKIYSIYIDLKNEEIEYATYNSISEYEKADKTTEIHSNYYLESMCHSVIDDLMFYDYVFFYFEEICEEIERARKRKKRNRFKMLNIKRNKMTKIR